MRSAVAGLLGSRVILYGVCIGNDDRFRTLALRGLQRIANEERILETRNNSSIFTAYNEILDRARTYSDVQALVLIHEDVEIRDARFEKKTREALLEPNIAIVGAIGATSVVSLRWWTGKGAGRCLETRGLIDHGGGTHDVQVVDGLMLILSPWAIRNLTFDEERYHGFHGYDADICFQALAADRRVIVADFDLIHHTKGGYGNLTEFEAADATFRSKWGLPGERTSRRVLTRWRRLRKASSVVRQ